MDTQTYQIPEFRLPSLKDRMAKLARKAAELGVEAPVMVVKPGITFRRCPTQYGVGSYEVPCVEVEVSIAPVRLSGWVFCGYIEHNDEAGNRLYTVEELPELYRTARAWCSHCNTERRRNGTYVVRSEETGEYRQVGSTCLEDFVGSNSAATAAGACAMLRETRWVFSDEDFVGIGNHSLRDTGTSLVVLLCYCMEAICRAGYLSRKNAEPLGQMATGDTAFLLLDNYKEMRRAWPDIDEREIAERHRARAEAVAAYWRDSTSNSEFDHNCQVLAKVGRAKGRDANLVAAMVSVYDRRQADLARAAGRKNEHVGVVGGKIEVEVTLDAIIPTFGMFPSQMHIMRDPENRELKWFASSMNQGMEPGKRYVIKAAVKKHDERGGERSTVLTRCTVKKVLAAAA